MVCRYPAYTNAPMARTSLMDQTLFQEYHVHIYRENLIVKSKDAFVNFTDNYEKAMLYRSNDRSSNPCTQLLTELNLHNDSFHS